MSYRPPGTLGVLRLLAKTSVLRLLRAARINKHKREAKTSRSRPAAVGRVARRGPTSQKRGDGLLWLMVLMLPLFLFQSVFMTGMAVGRLGEAAEAAAARTAAGARDGAIEAPSGDAAGSDFAVGLEQPRWGGRVGRRTQFELLAEPVVWAQPGARTVFVRCAALLLLTLFGMLLALGFGGANATLGGGEWTQAWLLTFPVRTRSLVLARALEYSLVQFFPWLTLAPLTWQLLRALGQPGALAIAIGATLLTTFLTGALRLWAETWLRLACSLRTLRSVQGVCTVVALVLMALAFTVVLGQSVPDWFLDVGAAVPTAITLLPAAWPVALPDHRMLAAVVGVAATVLVFVFAVAATSRLLAAGTMQSGGVDAGGRGQAGAWRRVRRLGIVGKDLAMLMRDRNFLVQVVVVPVFIIGLQLLVNPGLGKVEGNGVAMLAYGIGMYAVMGGCFQVLSAEGRALWMLYALPVAIGDVMRRKTMIWASISIAFGWTAMLVFRLRGQDLDAKVLLFDALTVGLGIWCSAYVAAAISVLGCNPNADYVPRQPKARHVYLYFFFASTYFVGLASDQLAPRMAGILVFATLAYAVWQRACDRLPWLLDPVDEASPRLGLFDGAAAVLVFFLLQTLCLLVIAGLDLGAVDVALLDVTLAFVVGGVATVVLFAVIVHRRGVDLIEALGLRLPGWRRGAAALLLGIAAGLGAGLLGLGYLHLNVAYDWFEVPTIAARNRNQLLLLAVVAAPVIEELLFRGLVLGGLLRTVRPALAIVWSAALFTVVHPVASWPPVFVMGAMAGFVYQRVRFLPAAMLLHATYNLVVVGWQ